MASLARSCKALCRQPMASTASITYLPDDPECPLVSRLLWQGGPVIVGFIPNLCAYDVSDSIRGVYHELNLGQVLAHQREKTCSSRELP